MCKIRGWSPENFDEADALGILDYANAVGDELFALEATPLFASPVELLTPKAERLKALKKAAGLK